MDINGIFYSALDRLHVLPAQGKKARMEREAAGNLRSLSKMAAQTLRESKRRMPKVISWGRTN